MPQIKDAKISDYGAYLIEHHRSPSRGGNGRALHSHRIKIDGEFYSWFAPGFRQWIYKTDTVSFEWEFDASGKYRNIVEGTIRTKDKNGKVVVRGEREFKKQMRTVAQRAPGSRRELRD